MGKKKRETALEKNTIFEAQVTGYTTEGAGVVRTPEGIPVFVPGAAQGDTLRVRVVKSLKTYAFGRIEEILSPSPDRVEEDCPVSRRCGGCVFRHISYEAELRAKEQRVRDALSRIGGFSDLPVLPILGAQQPNRYRNKAQFPIGSDGEGSILFGFYSTHSHRIIPCKDCLLHPVEFIRAMEAVSRWQAETGETAYNEETGKGTLRHLYLRKGFASGQVMVCIVANAASLRGEERLCELLRESVPGLSGVLLNRNTERTNVVLGKENRVLWGSELLEDTLCGLRFTLSPHSFYQVNRDQAERLYETAAQYAALTGKETVLDLYCGAGTIGLSMAARAKRLIGVEIVEDAVENARANAARNGVTNAEFFCGDAPKAAAMLRARGETPDVVILDPPRKGCGEELVDVVSSMSPRRVVYVSCDPATLARDLRFFSSRGYQPQEARPADLFPRTAHVETVVLLSKLNTKQHIEVELNLDELDLTAAESKATYDEIKAYVLEKYGLKVSSLYISQVKRKCGMDVGQNYNLSKKEDAKVPQCPPEKEAAIMDALKHFQMIM